MTVSLMGVRFAAQNLGTGGIETSSLKPERKRAPVDMIGVVRKNVFSVMSAPSAAPSASRHIIAILLQNEAGALSRVVGLFSTRGYNIESLSVAQSVDQTVSR